MNQQSRNSNSPLMAVIVAIWVTISFLWLGWPGLVTSTVAFFIGAVATIINLARRERRNK